MALIANNISGSISNSSRIGVTGSVIFANVPGSSFPSLPGADTFFFVSGSNATLGTTTRAVAAFGGDLHLSGTNKVDREFIFTPYVGTATNYSLYYDSAEESLTTYTYTGVQNIIGRQQINRGRNVDTVTITKGTPVRLTTALGSQACVVRAIAEPTTATSPTGNQIFGLAAEDILVNGTGYIVTSGKAYGFNTSALLNEGALVYVGTTSGSLTQTNPAPAYETIVVGTLERSHITQGKILVIAQEPIHLDDIAGFQSIVPWTTGQSVVYDGTKWSNNSSGYNLTGSFRGNFSGSLTKLTDGTSYLVADGNISITTGSTGAVTIGATGVAQSTSAFVTIGNDATLSSERALTAGTGLNLVDGGANSTVTLAINDSIVATVSGTNFKGNVGIKNTGAQTAPLQVSGSSNAASTPTVEVQGAWMRIGDGPADQTFNNGLGIKFHDVLNTHYSVGQLSGNFVIASTQDDGNVLFSPQRTETFVMDQYGHLGIGASPTVNARLFVSGTSTGITTLLVKHGLQNGSNLPVVDFQDSTGTSLLFLSGSGNVGIGTSTPSNKLDVVGAITANALTGSLTQLRDGTPYLLAGAGITLATGSGGAITITNDGTVGDITSVTAGTGLTGGGTSGAVTLAINDSIVATVSGTQFRGNVGVTGSLGASNLSVTGGVLYQSNGVIQQDGNLVWDATNDRLGIGIASPGRQLQTATGWRIGNNTDYFEMITAGGGIIRTAMGGAMTTLEFNNTALFQPGTTLGFQSANNFPSDAGFSRAAAGILNFSGSAPGALFRFNATSTPLAAGDLGMSTTSGRPTAYIGGVVRQLAHTNEIAPSTSSYVVMSSDGTLNNERVLTAGTGLILTDGGAGGNATLDINDSIVATVSGAIFSGDIGVNGGDITTTATTFNLINSNATTLNIGSGATTALNIGASAGVVTVAGDLKVSGNDIQASNGSTALTLSSSDVTVVGDLAVNGGDLTSSSSTFNLLNSGQTTLNFGTNVTTNLNVGTSATTSAITVGGTAQTGTTTLGRSTSTNTINIGNAATGQGSLVPVTQTISVGTAATGLGLTTISIGNNNSTSSVTVLAGSGNTTDMLLDGTTGTNYAIGPTTTTGTIKVGGTAQQGTITLGQSTASNTINIGNAGNNLARTQTVNIAAGASISAVTIGSTLGADTITLGQTTNDCTINIGTGITTTGKTQDVNIATQATDTGKSRVAIGNTNGASSLNLYAGTGNVSITGAVTTNYTIGTSTGTGTITLGATTATGQTINIGNGALGAGAIQTISIGAGSSAGSSNVTIGSVAGSSSTTVRGTTVTISHGTTGTGVLTVGNSTSGNTINIGNAAITGAQTIAIGTGATGAGTAAISIGSTLNASALTLSAGTGSMVLTGGTSGNILINNNAVSGQITLGATGQTGTITIGQSTDSNTINIGNAVVDSGKTQTVSIATGATGTASALVSIGSTGGSSATTIQGVTMTVSHGTTGTGTLTVGNSTASNTVNIANATTGNGNTQTINVATTATGTGKALISIGNTNAASGLILSAGTSGVTVSSGTGSSTISVGNVLTSTGNTMTVNVGYTGGAAAGMGTQVINIGKYNSTSGTVRVLIGGDQLAFFQQTTAQSRQTVSGAKGGNVALASLITALATYGLIVDSTS